MDISRTITKANKFTEREDLAAWEDRHRGAYLSPRKNERPIVSMLEALAAYADQHKAQFGRDLADDGFLGPAWLEMCRSFLQLLNGDLGRLDGGTLDKSVREMCRMAGFSEEEADTL